MEKNYFSIIRNKKKGIINKFKKIYFNILGLKIGKNVKLGNIHCEWPNKVLLGDGCIIEDNVVFKITRPFFDENFISIGKNVFIGNSCQINCNTQIKIGDDCMIASNTVLVDTGHEIILGIKINKQPLTISPISIENDVWIGANCTILKGVNIGYGSIIGAGSVVNRSIPPNQIWGGVPAKFIRNR